MKEIVIFGSQQIAELAAFYFTTILALASEGSWGGAVSESGRSREGPTAISGATAPGSC